MDIHITQVACLNELGGRSNNEDNIFPTKGKADVSDRLFLVCDGVGGAAKGELASQMVCNEIATYFEQQHKPFYESNDVHEATIYAENQLTEFLKTHPECKGMATTLTLINFHKNGATLAWAGDSRIYHVRAGSILFQSQDHSLVNLLLKQGEISEKEALDHPQKNVIIKAIKGRDEPAIPEVRIITDIKTNDYFLLCTDGVLENIDDDLIMEMLNGKQSPQVIAEMIQDLSKGHTNDNYSLYIVQLKVNKEDITGPAVSHDKSDETSLQATTFGKFRFLNRISVIHYLIILLLVLSAIYLIATYTSHPTQPIEDTVPIESTNNNSDITKPADQPEPLNHSGESRDSEESLPETSPESSSPNRDAAVVEDSGAVDRVSSEPNREPENPN